MTMDVYGHLVDHNLWAAAKRITGPSEDMVGALEGVQRALPEE
jgi:hypothetical protein